MTTQRCAYVVPSGESDTERDARWQRERARLLPFCDGHKWVKWDLWRLSEKECMGPRLSLGGLPPYMVWYGARSLMVAHRGVTEYKGFACPDFDDDACLAAVLDAARRWCEEG